MRPPWTSPEYSHSFFVWQTSAGTYENDHLNRNKENRDQGRQLRTGCWKSVLLVMRVKTLPLSVQQMHQLGPAIQIEKGWRPKHHEPISSAMVPATVECAVRSYQPCDYFRYFTLLYLDPAFRRLAATINRRQLDPKFRITDLISDRPKTGCVYCWHLSKRMILVSTPRALPFKRFDRNKTGEKTQELYGIRASLRIVSVCSMCRSCPSFSTFHKNIPGNRRISIAKAFKK